MTRTVTDAARPDRNRLPGPPSDVRLIDVHSARALRGARLTWAGWIRRAADLPIVVRLVGAELAECVSFRAGSCTVAPSGEIGRALGIAPAEVANAVTVLEQGGWLTRESGSSDGLRLFALSASLAALAKIDPAGTPWRDTRADDRAAEVA